MSRVARLLRSDLRACRDVIVVCLDLEGVLVPEIWISVAEHTGLDELRATTREIPDYHQLMSHRLAILAHNDLRIQHIQAVIAGLAPLTGAVPFLSWLRQRHQVVVLSDSFYQFTAPLMSQLQWPTLFCHNLEIDRDGRVANYRLRQIDHKRRAVEALQDLNFGVVAVGDAYNDVSMLAAAQHGMLFRPSPQVVTDFPQFPVVSDYPELQTAIREAVPELDRA